MDNKWIKMCHGFEKIHMKDNYPDDETTIIVSNGKDRHLGKVYYDDDGVWIDEVRISEFKYWMAAPTPPEEIK